MEFKLERLKKRIIEMRSLKNQMDDDDLDFFEAGDYVVTNTQSYWELDHIRFLMLDKRIERIYGKIKK